MTDYIKREDALREQIDELEGVLIDATQSPEGFNSICADTIRRVQQKLAELAAIPSAPVSEEREELQPYPWWVCFDGPVTNAHVIDANGRSVMWSTVEGAFDELARLLRAPQQQAEPQPWRVDLSCCGRDGGTYFFPTWKEADAFRNSYTSGPGVNPQGYSAHDSADGHRRAGIITGPDAPPPDDEAVRLLREVEGSRDAVCFMPTHEKYCDCGGEQISAFLSRKDQR